MVVKTSFVKVEDKLHRLGPSQIQPRTVLYFNPVIFQPYKSLCFLSRNAFLCELGETGDRHM